MKILLLCAMMVWSVSVFASQSYSQLKSEDGVEILQWQLKEKKIEAQQISEELSAITAAVNTELAIQKKIKEDILRQEYLTVKRTKREIHIQLLEESLQFAQNKKEKCNRITHSSEDDGGPIELFCEPLYCFQKQTAEQKMAANKIMDAIEGISHTVTNVPWYQKTFMGLKSLACCLCCYPRYDCYEKSSCRQVDCCGDYENRRQATFLLDGLELLAKNKLQELRLQQPLTRSKQAAQQAVQSMTISDRGEEKDEE